MRKSLPLLSILSSALIYAAHFFFGGGRGNLVLDSFAYLVLAEGGKVGVPFSTRVLTPAIASATATVTGLSTFQAFHLLTPAALLTSLILLALIVRRHNGSPEWQAGVLLAFGCSAAVTYGYTPVMVDPLLLLISCLTVLALDSGYVAAAVALAILAAVTKEYGLTLGLATCAVAYRRGRRALAFAGIVLPAAALLITSFSTSGSSAFGFSGWQKFVSSMFGYHLSLFRLRGASDYPKILYMWLWSMPWPVLILAVAAIVFALQNRIRLKYLEVAFLILLILFPVLLLGDWGRTLLIIAPFVFVIATSHPLARNPHFILLLAIGGLSTALARPFHAETAPPHLLTLVMTATSALSSLALGSTLVRHLFRSALRHKPESLEAAPEVAVS
ncbi:MAG TPA: hypothetical protein VGL29_12025 [Blastocatellia bacterium]